jgi:hypothetical protein
MYGRVTDPYDIKIVYARGKLTNGSRDSKEDRRMLEKQSPPNCILQGHSKIVQRCNTNSGAQASEDSLELAA